MLLLSHTLPYAGAYTLVATGVTLSILAGLYLTSEETRRARARHRKPVPRLAVVAWQYALSTTRKLRLK